MTKAARDPLTLLSLFRKLQKKNKRLELSESLYLICEITRHLVNNPQDGDLLAEDIKITPSGRVLVEPLAHIKGQISQQSSIEKLSGLSPERLSKTSGDSQSQVFTIATFLWRMVKGHPLFESQVPSDIYLQIQQFEVKNLKSENQTGQDFYQLVCGPLNEDPEQRTSIKDLLDQIDRALKKNSPSYTRTDFARSLAPYFPKPESERISISPIYENSRSFPWFKSILFVALIGGLAYRYFPLVRSSGGSGLLKGIQSDVLRLSLLKSHFTNPLEDPNKSFGLQKRQEKAEKSLSAASSAPQAQTVALVFHSEPSQAQIWLNGKNMNLQTPAQIQVLSDQKLSVIFRKSGYQDCQIQASAGQGRVSCVLQK